jgi:hypothetical protein
MIHKKIILNFVYKFFCILKAASDGWIIRYIGGNQFEFISCKKMDIKSFIDKYTKQLPSIITNI